MSIQGASAKQAQSLADVSGNVAKYLPEPSVSGVGMFKDAMNLASRVGSTVLSGGTSLVGDSFADLLETQMRVQQEMQATSMSSNIEKSKHESKMSAIRNIRVS